MGPYNNMEGHFSQRCRCYLTSVHIGPCLYWVLQDNVRGCVHKSIRNRCRPRLGAGVRRDRVCRGGYDRRRILQRDLVSLHLPTGDSYTFVGNVMAHGTRSGTQRLCFKDNMLHAPVSLKLPHPSVAYSSQRELCAIHRILMFLSFPALRSLLNCAT